MFNLINYVSNLLTINYNDIFKDEFWLPGGAGADFAFMRPFLTGLSHLVWPFVAFIGSVGCIYAIVLGIKMAKADGQQAADAKKKIVGAVSSMIIIIVLLVLYEFVVVPNLDSIFAFLNELTLYNPTNS